ncbi:hypothetical protein MTW91_01865 [Mammaliicoccus sciuri]|uniref:hypothetical protein n=1 Tax=Mammaliicoccus sciuri TaxID=1296 RepID=UPI001FB46B96|nr:hypothetical protein [Mammaliicoccus sciuri]MCJ0924030.1 hypothetical protein [Mammaliicoccus sciuri]
MATDKQVKYVQSLQEQCDIDEYEEHEIKAMNNKEISTAISELKKYIAEDDLYNECMSYGLPNQ